MELVMLLSAAYLGAVVVYALNTKTPEESFKAAFVRSLVWPWNVIRGMFPGA